MQKGDVCSLFDQLISEALSQPFSGWDFAFVQGRMVEQPLPWDYAAIVRQQMQNAETMLDMGTGGGECLSSLAPLSKHMYATEGYAPNMPVARARLEPLGVRVVETRDKRALPFAGAMFDLVINRHSSWWGSEVYRLLKPDGLFITQQVGANNLIELNYVLQGSEAQLHPNNTAENAEHFLRAAGFEVLEQQTAYPETTFTDLGAIVFYLRAVAWQVPDFSVAKHYDQLAAIHNTIQQTGRFVAHAHRFLVVARKPHLSVH